jgi:hypothetical protein
MGPSIMGFEDEVEQWLAFRRSSMECSLSHRRGGVQSVTVWRQWQDRLPPHAPSTLKRHRVRASKPQIWPVDNPVDNPDQHYLRASVLAMKEAENWV